jgi:hypothetical protein
MPKRHRSSTKTVIDKYYQYIYGHISTEPGDDATESYNLSLPPAPPQFVGSGASLVREFLKVDGGYACSATHVGHVHYYAWGITYRPITQESDMFWNNPNCVCYWHKTRYPWANESDPVPATWHSTVWIGDEDYAFGYDFTDQNGNGRIIASDRLQINAHVSNSAEEPIQFAAHFRIWYRWAKIKLIEYIGLLSDQQSVTGTS